MLSLRWKLLSAAALFALSCAGIALALPATAPRSAAPAARLAPVPKGAEPAMKPLELKHDLLVQVLAFSPDGQRLFAGEQDGRVVVWELPGGKRKASLKTGKAAVGSLAVSRDGKRLAAGDEGGVVRLWTADTLKEVATVRLNNQPWVLDLAFSRDGKELLGVIGTNEVRRWDAASGKGLPPLPVGEMKEGARSVTVSADGKRVLVGSQVSLNVGTNWSAFHVVDRATGKATQSLNGPSFNHTKAPEKLNHRTPVAFRPDGKGWLGAASDGKLYGPDGKGLGGHNGEVTGVAFLPKGGIAVTASKDQTVRFWDVEKRQELARVRDPARIMTLALSADGKVVAWAASDRVVRVRAVATLLKQGKVKDIKGPSLVGAWLTQRQPGGPAAGLGLTITFTADGKLTYDTGKGQVEYGSYKVDDTKDPPEIDFVTPARANPANKKPPLLGIYRVEKDTLTLYLNEKKRPAKFEAPDGSGIMKVTLNRANKE